MVNWLHTAMQWVLEQVIKARTFPAGRTVPDAALE
jgi:hypothetical protein